MSKLGAGLVAFVILVAAVAGGLYLFSLAPSPGEDIGTVETMVIDFTPMDRLAGSQDAATSDVLIYRNIDGEWVQQEEVVMDAASKASVLLYTTGEQIGLYIRDDTDVSICEQYLLVTVPRASSAEVYGSAFQYTIWNVDREVTMPMTIESGGVEITDGELEDLSTNGWDTAYAYLDVEMRPDQDDMGYVNTDNFLLGQKNNHYFIMDISDVSGSTLGGWYKFNVLGSGFQTFDRNDHRYYVWALSDADIERNLQASGIYSPDGLWQLNNLAVDLTSFSAGNNITISYDYIMYADWDHFVSSGSWGADVELAGEETFYIQY